MNALNESHPRKARLSVLHLKLLQCVSGAVFLIMIAIGIGCAALLVPDLLRKNW